MTMTKKFKVSFDVTAKMTSDVQAILEKDMLHLCKQVGSGAIVPNDKQKEMIVQFLTHGMEGLMTFVVRIALREAIKYMHEEYIDKDSIKLSPATVREVF
ncbi:HNS binding protein [Edwardsiella phage PVN09]|uniref:HNS binding protein n=1 Tax=Edwardsiella phage PVN09 TaxID=2859518 RepID=A0AAE7VK77_9CAUD|nr:HNS binding protein [Edwardsiella phage PVN09]